MVKRIGRRQFLQGAGGFTLALPFLPSLLTRAEAAGLNGVMPRMIMLTTDHGGLHPRYLYPLRPSGDTLNDFYYPLTLAEYDTNRVATTFTSQQLYSGHNIQRAPLAGLRYSANGRTGISPVLSSADAQLMSNDLISKMHIHQGVDLMLYVGHTSGGLLGNYPASDQITAGVAGNPIPTVDQVVAYSNRIYPNGTGFIRRSVHVGGRQLAWRYANDASYGNTSLGTSVVAADNATSPQALWDSFFQGFTPPGGGTNPDLLVVDRVRANWQSLRSRAFGTNRRLSQEDGSRLDAFMQFLYEIERRINALSAPVTCTVPTRPTQAGNDIFGGAWNTTVDANASLQAYADVICAAMMCGSTRVATMSIPAHGVDYSGDWHQDVAHVHTGAAAQRNIIRGEAENFEKVFLRIANTLNGVVEENGRTYLDNSLVAWMQESGPHTHDSDSTPIIAAGGGAGFFNPGYYYDYRNTGTPYPNLWGRNRIFGIPWSRWLVSVLQSMGLSASDYLAINENRTGYGSHYQLTANNSTYYNVSDMHRPLPWSTNG